jgi:phosphoenolpyruvate-protein kinase (PTS system EI component)
MDDEDTGMADELEQQQQQQQQQKQQEGMPATLEETQQQAVQQQAYVSQSAQQAQQHGLVGVGVPRPAPTYSVQTPICRRGTTDPVLVADIH